MKDENDEDLPEADKINKDGKNTQQNYTNKVLMTQIATKVFVQTQLDNLEILSSCTAKA